MSSIIKTKDGKRVIDYMAKDYESFRQAMIDLIPQKLPQWTDRSEADFGIVLIELFAYMADILSYYEDRIANESFLATAQERRSVIHHLRMIGYALAPAAPASALLSLTLSTKKIKELINAGEKSIQIEKGAQFATKSSETEESITFEYVGEEPLSIDLDKDFSGNEESKKYVGIPIIQGKTVSEEKIGTSDGTPNQIFKLSRSKMIRDSLKIQVKTPDKVDDWVLKSSLIFSGHNDKHYLIQTDENDMTTVYFGDNLYGKIPEKDAEIIATYRVGGDRDGNVGANKIIVISNAPKLKALAAKVTNETSASGGKERESIEHAIKFAPRVFRSLKRAVTKRDFTNLALSFPGVAKARAKGSGWNKINLYIVPEGKQCQPPTKTLKKKLINFFENKRMVGTFVDIQDPVCVAFNVWLKVTVAHNYFADQVKKKVEDAIRTLFEVDNVNFGQLMYISKIYETVEALEGVDAVFVYIFNRRDDLEFQDGQKAKDLSSNELTKRLTLLKETEDLETYVSGLVKNPIASEGMVKMRSYEIPTLGELTHEPYIRTEDGLLKEEGPS